MLEIKAFCVGFRVPIWAFGCSCMALVMSWRGPRRILLSF
jgi:hypothetical protein